MVSFIQSSLEVVNHKVFQPEHQLIERTFFWEKSMAYYIIDLVKPFSYGGIQQRIIIADSVYKTHVGVIIVCYGACIYYEVKSLAKVSPPGIGIILRIINTWFIRLMMTCPGIPST